MVDLQLRDGAIPRGERSGRVQQGLGLFPQRGRRRQRLGPRPRQDLHEPVRRRQLGQGSAADTNGAFSGRMAFRGSGDHSEYIRARFVGDATFATSLSSVVTQAVVTLAVAAPPSPPTSPPPAAEPPATPDRSEPAPTTPKNLSPTMLLLALVSILLAAAAALLRQRVRMDRSSGRRTRPGRRTNASRKPPPFDDPDDDLEYPL